MKNTILIPSMGRCGTQLIKNGILNEYSRGNHINFILKKINMKPGFVHGSHSYPEYYVDFTNIKILFLYGDPLNSIISVLNKKEWKNHIYNFTGRKDIELNSIIYDDILSLNNMFDFWYKRHDNYDIMCVRYDQIYDQIDNISEYLELNKKLKIEPYKKRKSNWKTHKHKGELMETYGDLYEKIMNSESKIFKKI